MSFVICYSAEAAAVETVDEAQVEQAQVQEQVEEPVHEPVQATEEEPAAEEPSANEGTDTN